MKIKKIRLIVLLLIVFASGILVGGEIKPLETAIIKVPVYKEVDLNEQTATMKLPAINKNGTGVSAVLTVKVRQGNGLILVNINDILAELDVQQSARVAALVASEYTKMGTENLDIFYDVNANASVLEGPSGGAAFAITTIAALENKSLNPKVMISGSINHDGVIGITGKVYEKALVAKKEGADLFLVPLGTSQELEYKKEEYCYGPKNLEYCNIEIVPKKTDISKEVGIEIKEVYDIEEAVSYFFE